MAAPQQAAAAAAVPPVAPPTVSYRDFFNNANNDPYTGAYNAVLQNYRIGAGAALQPAQLRTLISNSRLQNAPNAFILQDEADRKLHIYVQLERFEP